MILYLDTSSLAKLYLKEDGTEKVKSLSSSARTVFSSLTTYVEARSALARATAAHRLTGEEYRRALGAFETEWRTFSIRDVTLSLVRFAGDLAEKHLLRGFDAIHLASAVTLQSELGEPITFSSADERLMSAAQAESLSIP